MMTRILTGASAAAFGAAMLAISATSASAFSLQSPSLQAPVASANIEQARWWHHRHCWRGRWGHLHCRNW